MRRFTKPKTTAASSGKAPRRMAVKKDSEAENDAEGGVSPDPSTSLNENGSSNVPKDEDSDEAETFEVELILGSRVRHGKQQFKIRWKGYGPADDTWEDEENVDSPELIAAYLRGSPDEDKVKKTPKKNLKIPPRPKGKKRSNTSELKEKPAKKPKPDKDDENAEWEVSKIVDYVELKDGTRQFLVRWKGFTSKENTWEPEANLNCADLIEKFLAFKHQQDETTRETREVRKQVFKYNPELTKRSSQRSSTKRSGGDSSVDGPGNITSRSYFQRGDSSLKRSPINLSNMPSWSKSRGSYTFSSKVNSPWYSNLSSNCVVM